MDHDRKSKKYWLMSFKGGRGTLVYRQYYQYIAEDYISSSHMTSSSGDGLSPVVSTVHSFPTRRRSGGLAKAAWSASSRCSCSALFSLPLRRHRRTLYCCSPTTWGSETWAAMDTPPHSPRTWTDWRRRGSGSQTSTSPAPSAARPGNPPAVKIMDVHTRGRCQGAGCLVTSTSNIGSKVRVK